MLKDFIIFDGFPSFDALVAVVSVTLLDENWPFFDLEKFVVFQLCLKYWEKKSVIAFVNCAAS